VAIEMATGAETPMIRFFTGDTISIMKELSPGIDGQLQSKLRKGIYIREEPDCYRHVPVKRYSIKNIAYI
jgi:hypothetical protein